MGDSACSRDAVCTGCAAVEAASLEPSAAAFAEFPAFVSAARALGWAAVVVTTWLVVSGLLLYMLASLLNRHFARDIATRLKEWRWGAIREDVNQYAAVM